MQRRIGAIGQEPDTFVEEYPIYFTKNVTHIEAINDKEQEFGWNVTEKELDTTGEQQIYLYLDGQFNDPFGHWVFEVGIYLPLFSLLKQQYPTLKLLNLNPKRYKDVFYKGFGLTPDDLASSFSDKNTIIFTQWNSLGDHIPYRSELFMQYIKRFWNGLVSSHVPLQKTINLLYLPRGSKENFQVNDRTLPCQEFLTKHIQNYIPNTTIFYTDETENIKDQIGMIRSASYILLDYGSSLLVNGFFAENSIIFVIGDNDQLHCKNPKPYFLLKDSLDRGCKYVYLPWHAPADYIISIILYSFQNTIPFYQHKCRCWKNCDDCKKIP